MPRKRENTEGRGAAATFGVALLLFGIVMLVHPRWTTSSSARTTQIGPAKVITETRGYREIPSYASIAALIAGGVLVLWAVRKF